MTKRIADKAVLIYPEFDTQDTFWSYRIMGSDSN